MDFQEYIYVYCIFIYWFILHITFRSFDSVSHSSTCCWNKTFDFRQELRWFPLGLNYVLYSILQSLELARERAAEKLAEEQQKLALERHHRELKQQANLQEYVFQYSTWTHKKYDMMNVNVYIDIVKVGNLKCLLKVKSVFLFNAHHL